MNVNGHQEIVTWTAPDSLEIHRESYANGNLLGTTDCVRQGTTLSFDMDYQEGWTFKRARFVHEYESIPASCVYRTNFKKSPNREGVVAHIVAKIPSFRQTDAAGQSSHFVLSCFQINRTLRDALGSAPGRNNFNNGESPVKHIINRDRYGRVEVVGLRNYMLDDTKISNGLFKFVVFAENIDIDRDQDLTIPSSAKPLVSLLEDGSRHARLMLNFACH